MHTFLSDSEALQVLDQAVPDTSVREDAVVFLGSHPTPANLNRLASALDDSAFAVRWTAAVALTKAGDAALAPLLHVLSERSSLWLREGAHHVLHYSASADVQEKTSGLLKAMRGPASDVATMTMAGKLLQTLTH